MQQSVRDILKDPQALLTSHMPETIAGMVSAVLTLLAVLIAFKVTKGIMIRALTRQHRTEPQIKQVMTLWRYTFLLIGIVFMTSSMKCRSGSPTIPTTGSPSKR